MKYLVYSYNGGAPEAGVLVKDRVISISGCGFGSLLPVIAGGAAARATIEAHLAKGHPGVPLADVKLHAPIPNPPKLFMIGLNYRDHAIESGMAIPTTPTVFSKFNNSIIGPGDTVVLPKASAQPDYEAEFAFVIGKTAKHVKAADWKEYVFGYTVINDVSARDLQLASPQWLMGKSCDTFCPMGPTLVTAEEIADPHNLQIKLTLNGEVLQNSNTKELIFNIPALIEHITQVITLEPGDVISTGTPPGVGFARKPPVYLRDGDDCVVYVEGLGELRNPVAVEA
ncbi:MAG: fumarylacetoacetate hydrolase family protein [Bryobacteraceae bacterium]|nr:fumarylacetoacetate hydrolase family protein [Bryobacteraceae bacterium]